MRSLVLAFAILLGATSSPAADPPQPVVPQPLAKLIKSYPAGCASLAEHRAARPGEPLKPRKLTDLPSAKAYHAVLRAGLDGCPDPLFVDYQYGLKP